MKVRICILFALLATASTVFAQSQSCSTEKFPRCTDSQTVANSGDSVYINSNGGMNPSFEEVVSGSPSTLSVVISGCMPAGTCEVLDTYSATATTIRNPLQNKVYTKYKVTVTWTGGSTPTVQINTVQTTSRNNFPSASVKLYGARGDGITNDTSTIQASLDAGGTSYLPPGTYMVSKLTVHSGSSIICDNPNTTIIKSIAGSNSSTIVGDVLGYPGTYTTITAPYMQTYGSGTANGTNGVRIYNCQINTNAYDSATNTELQTGAGPYYGVELYGGCFVFMNNIITNTKGDGLRWEYNATLPFHSYPLCDHTSVIKDNWISHYGMHYGEAGVAATTSATWTTSSNTVTVSSATGIAAGLLVSGPGIPANTEVLPSYVSGTSIPLSSWPTAGTSGTLVFYNHATSVDYNGAYGIHLVGGADNILSNNDVFQGSAGCALISAESHSDGQNHCWGSNQYGANGGPIAGVVHEAQTIGTWESEGSYQPNAYLVSTTATAASGATSLTVAATSGPTVHSQTYNIVPGMTVRCAGVPTGSVVASTYSFGSTTVPLTFGTTAALSSTACTFGWPTPQIAILSSQNVISNESLLFTSAGSVQSLFDASGIQVGQMAGTWAYPGTISQTTPGNLSPTQVGSTTVQVGYNIIKNVMAQNLFDGSLYIANDVSGYNVYDTYTDNHLASNAANTALFSGTSPAATDMFRSAGAGPTCVLGSMTVCPFDATQLNFGFGGVISTPRINEMGFKGPFSFVGNAYTTQSCGSTGCNLSLSNSGWDVAYIQLTLSASSTGATLAAGTGSGSMRTRAIYVANANSSGFSLTFDVFGTSHVYSGTSCVVAGGTGRWLFWDNTGWLC